MLGKIEEAKVMFDKAIQINEKYANTYINKGYISIIKFQDFCWQN